MILPRPPFRLKGLSLIALVLALGCALIPVRPAQAAQSDEPRWGWVYNISGNIAVRENPSDDALKVRALKSGQRVRVDFQDAGWAAVFDPKEFGRSELKAWGYVRLDELHMHGTPVAAAASSIEVRKPRPDAKPEVLVNGKPDKQNKPKMSDKADNTSAVKTSKASESALKADGAAPKPAPKPAPESVAKPGKYFGELRVPDRDLAVRASRTTESEFKKLIRPGQRVLVDFWEDGWFAVFDPAEKSRDLAKAWGFSRDKYLVPEGAYSAPPPGAVPAAAVSPAAVSASPAAPVPAKAERAKPAEEPAVGYAVLERKIERKPPAVTLRVRLDLSQPPAPDALRKIVREIWKAEHKKDENLQIEVLLTGMDTHGLAYALARFHADGRIREFWWREVVLGHPEK